MSSIRCAFAVTLAALVLVSAGAYAGPTRPDSSLLSERIAARRATAEFQAVKALPSLSHELAELAAMWESDKVKAAAAASRNSGMQINADGAVLVWVMQEPGKTAESIDLRALRAQGASVAGQSEHFLEAWVPLPALARVAKEVPGVTFLRLPPKWEPHTVSQGVSLTGASDLHDVGVYGSGAKVAVVDMGFYKLSNAVSAGELPSSLIAADFSGTGMESGTEVHGTACLEIVHDMAPQCQLYAVKIGDTLSSAENALNWCVSQGIHIISCSLGLTNINFFDGQGEACGLVNSVYSQGVLPIFSAGNYAGNYSDCHHEGVITDGDSDTLHEFAPGNEVMGFTAAAGQSVLLVLNWDRWPVTNQDYDLYVLNSSLDIVWGSEGSQTGSQPPVEGGIFVPPYSGQYYLGVVLYSASPGIRYEIYARHAADFEYPVASSSLCCPGDATGSLTVGAITYSDWYSGPQASYSSQGPTNDGRTKPDIAAPAGVSTYAYGSSPFHGTSAAAPHVGGAAALLKSAHPSWTASQIRSELLGSAVDMGAYGMDNLYGYGRLNLVSPFTTLSVNSTPVSGVSVGVSPADEYGQGAGTTSFTRSYSTGATVSLSAAASSGDYGFSYWDIDGYPQEEGAATIWVTMDSPHTATAHYGTQHFTDVPPYHWAYDYIEACSTAGIVGGYPDGSYAPAGTVDRGQMSVFVSRALAGGDAGVPNPTADPGFTDVNYTHWAYKYICYAVDQHIVTGYPEGDYRPSQQVTRDQMAVYMARAMVAPSTAVLDSYVPASPRNFPDVPSTHWAYKYVEYCVEEGVVGGYPDGTYLPDAIVTRDQMAVYIQRAFELPM